MAGGQRRQPRRQQRRAQGRRTGDPHGTELGRLAAVQTPLQGQCHVRHASGTGQRELPARGKLHLAGAALADRFACVVWTADLTP
jgi:hypothetical protein